MTETPGRPSIPVTENIEASDLAEIAEVIQLRVGIWEALGYANPPTPDSATIPPLGERDATAIQGGHDAIEDIDHLISRLHEVRAALVSQLRTNQDIQMSRPIGYVLTPQASQ